MWIVEYMFIIRTLSDVTVLFSMLQFYGCGHTKCEEKDKHKHKHTYTIGICCPGCQAQMQFTHLSFSIFVRFMPFIESCVQMHLLSRIFRMMDAFFWNKRQEKTMTIYIWAHKCKYQVMLCFPYYTLLYYLYVLNGQHQNKCVQFEWNEYALKQVHRFRRYSKYNI